MVVLMVAIDSCLYKLISIADCRLLGVVQRSILPSHLQPEWLSRHAQRPWTSVVSWAQFTSQDIPTWPGHCCRHEIHAGDNEIQRYVTDLSSITTETFTKQIIQLPKRGTKHCDEYVCLSGYLSVCISQIPHGKTSPNFCACCVWPWLGPPLTVLRYVMYFQFCGCHHLFIPFGGLCGASCVF